MRKDFVCQGYFRLSLLTFGDIFDGQEDNPLFSHHVPFFLIDRT